jgi:hypothetical protein
VTDEKTLLIQSNHGATFFDLEMGAIDFKFKFAETSKPIFLITYSQGYLAVPRKKDGVTFFVGRDFSRIPASSHSPQASPLIVRDENPAHNLKKETVQVQSLWDLL